jgi:Uncharacterized protein conserved in bacteria (DUF2330)
MKRILSIAVLIAAGSTLVSLALPDAEGCAAVRRPQDPPIVIAEESAIIVWDSVKKVEHFIRRAAFDTPSPDFGFLVPTPDVPTLKELNDALFRDADRWIQPKIVEKASFRFGPMFCCLADSFKGSRPSKADMAPKDGVRVLSEQVVGGFKSAVLEADNTESLSNWLKENGYSSDPELQSWLAPYIAEKWKITAFKIMQDAKTGQLAQTKPVRMSFRTDRPFFPYREPESKPKTDVEKQKENVANERKMDRGEAYRDSRLLRVHFVSAGRMDGVLGNAAWHAKVKWADQLTDEQRVAIVRDAFLGDDGLPAKVWMTTFEDTASPRPGKDEVYFDPAKDPTPIRPPDFIRYYDVHIPIDCVLICVFLVGLIAVPIAVKRLRKKSV